MKKKNGMKRYLYEYAFHQAIERARDQAAEIIPISQARHIRARVDALLKPEGVSIADDALKVSQFLPAVDQALREQVPDYEDQFGDHTPQNERYLEIIGDFSRRVGFSGPARGPVALPISPYDPDWADRATVKAGGTALSYLADQDIEQRAGGVVADLASPRHGDLKLHRFDKDDKFQEAGRAMTYEDASGLTRLMGMMSPKEYEHVRSWVIDGGKDPRTGQIDLTRYMPRRAIERSVAILEELRDQGTAYTIERDRSPGQIKARITGTSMEIRLTDRRENEAYAGARIYDNGMETRYSTNYRPSQNTTAVHSPSPEEAIELLRFAQGRTVLRDDVNDVVGRAGRTHMEYDPRSRKQVTIPDSYHGPKDSMFVVGDYVVPDGSPNNGAKLMIRRDATSRTLPSFFLDEEKASAFAEEAVRTARENLTAAVDVETFVELAERYDAAGDDEIAKDEIALEVMDHYSADSEVAAIQRSYWDVLTGQRDQLLRPGATQEMFDERLDAIGELQAGEDFSEQMGNLVYHGSPADKVRQHAEDVPFELIGTWEPEPHEIDGEWVDKRFDPGRVAKYMTSASGQWSNLDDLASALRAAKVSPEEMLGTGFQATRFKDRLVTFDEETAVPLSDHESPFLRRVGETVRESLSQNAAVPGEILVDEKGVIRWQAEKLMRDGSLKPITGQVGQIFDRGEYGEVVTQFASGENALIVPGYEARIRAPRVDEPWKSVEERTMLRGYEQIMLDQVRYQVSGDLMSGRTQVGDPAGLNAVYSRLYGTKHPVDYIERNRDLTADGQLDSWTASILQTEARRVRYGNEIKEGSTTYAAYQAEKSQRDLADDNASSTWDITGRNMGLLVGKDSHGKEIPKGYFDPMMTGGASNQGIVRYLTQDAVVKEDGMIVPGDPETPTGLRTPLMLRPELETLQYDPFDRQQMTTSTVMQASKVTEPTGTALMTFGGWTADDPIVVSREFADRNHIRGAGGALRELVIGDKLSDLHGNKGVISLIVDRDMDLEEARAKGLEKEVAWFQANPTMDVVMSPFSLVSRRNAGSARELMRGEVSELRAPDVTPEERLQAAIRGDDAESLDRSTPAGIGQIRFVVTHMAVDEKTKIYDEDQLRAGKGRKASSQLAWALQAQGCSAIMAEFYGHNSGAEQNVREILNSTGIGMDADGSLFVIGKSDGADEQPERRLFEMPELVLTKKGTLNTTAMNRGFGELIGDKGGDLEIPFPLKYPTGQTVPEASGASWRMPILSSHLRSGQEFDDGTSVAHDYTRQYQGVFAAATEYRYLQERLESDEQKMTPQMRQKMVTSMRAAADSAQRAFDTVNQDLSSRVLSGKRNIFKTGLMSSRLPDSATMVGTSDPRLDVDTVAMSSAKAAQLGLKADDYAMIWRDPVLRDGAARYMKIAVNDDLTGIAMHPAVVKSMDGDFDGDSWGVAKLHTQAAQEEALQHLTVAQNLLDTGTIKPDGRHELSLNVTLDTKVALSKNADLADEFDSIEKEANLIHLAERTGRISPEDARAQREDLVGQLSEQYREALSSTFGDALSFESVDTHLRTIDEVCVQTGAKGSPKKLAEYAKNLGGEDGLSGITEEDQRASMLAARMKVDGTGLAGGVSQKVMKVVREFDPKAGTETTYPVTQSVLQAKHDAAEAAHKYAMLHSAGPDHWRGRKLEHVGDGEWRPVFEDGKPVQATREEWEQQFEDLYTSEIGFNVGVNPEYISRIAEIYADPQTNVMRDPQSEPSLQGAPLDRLAYGGTFDTVVELAEARESIWAGELSGQFASRSTRRLLEAQKQALENDTWLQPEVLDELSKNAIHAKSDVLADQVEGAKTRGGHRRSEHVVTARTPARHRPRPQFEFTDASTSVDDDYEMGA